MSSSGMLCMHATFHHVETTREMMTHYDSGDTRLAMIRAMLYHLRQIRVLVPKHPQDSHIEGKHSIYLFKPLANTFAQIMAIGSWQAGHYKGCGGVRE